MPRQRSPDRDKAFEIYKKHNGNIELVEIAKKLNRPEGTIRGWKKKDKWDDKLNGTLQKEKRNVTKKVTKPKNNKRTTVSKQEKEIVQELEDADLTEKQRLFCLYYVKTFNATQSAIKAGYSKDTAHVIGHENLRKPKIAAEIKRLKGTMTQDIFIDAMDVLRKYITIAFADITDYVSFGREEVIVDKDEEGNPITKEFNTVKLKDSSEVDGTILSEVSQGRDGVKVKLLDKMKALEKLEKYFDLLPDKWKRQIEEEKLKLQKQKMEKEEDKTLKVTIIDDIK